MMWSPRMRATSSAGRPQAGRPEVARPGHDGWAPRSSVWRSAYRARSSGSRIAKTPILALQEHGLALLVELLSERPRRLYRHVALGRRRSRSESAVSHWCVDPPPPRAPWAAPPCQRSASPAPLSNSPPQRRSRRRRPPPTACEDPQRRGRSSSRAARPLHERRGCADRDAACRPLSACAVCRVCASALGTVIWYRLTGRMYTLYVIPGSHACRSAMLMLEHEQAPTGASTSSRSCTRWLFGCTDPSGRADAYRGRTPYVRASLRRSPRHGARARRQRPPHLDQPRDRALPGRASPTAAAVPGRSRAQAAVEEAEAGPTKRFRWPPAGSWAPRCCATRPRSADRPETAGSVPPLQAGADAPPDRSEDPPRGLCSRTPG